MRCRRDGTRRDERGRNRRGLTGNTARCPATIQWRENRRVAAMAAHFISSEGEDDAKGTLQTD